MVNNPQLLGSTGLGGALSHCAALNDASCMYLLGSRTSVEILGNSSSLSVPAATELLVDWKSEKSSWVGECDGYIDLPTGPKQKRLKDSKATVIVWHILFFAVERFFEGLKEECSGRPKMAGGRWCWDR